MAQRTYFPVRDALLVSWANNFASVLSSDPGLYGATPEIAASFMTTANNLAAAYATAMEPSTRTKGVIASKNDAITAMKIAARAIVRVIYTKDLPDEQLIAIGLRPRGARSAIPVPDAAPALKVLSVFGHNIRVRIRDASGQRRGRAEGCAGALLYSFVGADAPTSTSAWTSEGCVTSGSITVMFPASVPAGSKVFLTCCWMNPRGMTGPGCTPVVSQIGYEGSMPLAG
jgi:hypothetical protein